MKQTACPWSARDDVFEGYVRDALGPDERSAFEAHYFECDACATRLQVYQGLQKALASTAVVGARARQPVPAESWWWVAAPVAAGVLIIVASAAVWLNLPAPVAPESTVAVAPAAVSPAAPPSSGVATPAAAPPSSPAATPAPPPVVPLSILARVEAPAYVPATQLRATPSEAAERFDAAMRRLR